MCAPTGAGKTNIAMIAILREVAANMQQGQVNKLAFKIVYVAPMKALAAEQTATFSRRLADLGRNPCSVTYWYPLTQALYGMNLCCRCAAGSDSKAGLQDCLCGKHESFVSAAARKGLSPSKEAYLDP